MAITYNYSSDWVNRDSLPDSSDTKVVRAADFEAEWISIKNAFALAAPAASPTFTGTVTATTIAASGNVTGANLNIANWNTAFSWGNHASAGYLTTVSFADLTGKPTTLSGYGITDAATSAQGALADTAVQPGDNISTLTNNSGFYKSGDSPTFNDTTTTTVSIGDWEIYVSGSTLKFRHSGVDRFALTSTGALTVEGDVTASGAA